jgi:AraC-like DNA-binding protein
MAEPDPEFRLMRFSSDALPAVDRFEIWRDTMTRKLLRVAIDSTSDSPFRAKAALRSLPSLKVGIGSVGASIHHRTREFAAKENDDVALVVNLRGRFYMRSGGDDWLLREGDGFLIECSDVGAFIVAEPGAQLCVRLGRGLLGAFAKHVERSLGRVIPAQTEALSLLTTYARTLPSGVWEVSPAAGQVMVDHIADLTALLVGSSGDSAALARNRGLAAARLGRAKTYIREHAGSVDLSAEAVATEQHISSRYLRRLFEAEEQSFTGYLLEQRLSQAYAMLTSRQFAAQPISHIAFEVGFGDLSYFNRAFRRRYERTPRDVKAEATQAWRMAAE